MPQPDGPPTPPNPVSALSKATGIGADPKGLSDLQQNMKLGMMPMPAPGGVLAGLQKALSPVLSVVEPAAPVAQVAPSSFAVDNLISGLKDRLAQIPNAAPKLVSTGEAMGTSAQAANDMLHPSSLQMMDKLYQQANPVFKGLQEAGQFNGPRINNVIPSIYK